MTRRNPPAKWVLPAIVDPPDRVCYTIAVPKERQHIAAFLGALQNLGSGAQWADDEAHTAKDVAQVWREIIDNLCSSEPDENGDCCVDCSPVNAGFLDGLEPGQTKTLRLVVEAGEYNILPILMFASQSITLSDFRGQWRDSTYHPEMDCSSNWETPLGIVINAVAGATAETFITDVMPEVPHMKLIMRVNNCGILTYHDLDDPITFTVPSSVSPDGVFVEFLGNVPVDEDGEIAAGFLGYGMVCIKAIVADLNLCPQVFIDFEPPSLPLFNLIIGSIVSSSPIGEGAALENGEPQVISSVSIIEVQLDGCTIRDMAFTVWSEASGSSGPLQLQLVAYNEVNQVIDNFDEEFNLSDQTIESFTVQLSLVPGVFKLRMAWTIVSAPNDQATFFIDNVFVN